ncbi:C4-dicarboxylate transporter DctM subunit [Algoriphagus sp. 4150]|uniref:TRAP transporter large permease n=1 Tax=Algoriphagus sp. 4150 TaxID=2817756 RepID=UPI0028613DAC|nr:TRAP transporter large permease [Algoriphagus sp. 4150]MDR7131591.1 C4-dicarboxylate transporter DctM subunit [Algoriphagus sp. 4150]
MGTVLIIVFLILIFLDVPVSFSMLLSSLAALVFEGVNPIMVGLETTRSLSTFYSFLAVPFFILAGELMNFGGLSERLIRLVKAFIGHYRIGLPAVTTVSSQMFGAVSGASAATVAAIGGIMIPTLERNGYSRAFATALTACSGTTGALIPPSILLLIYGTLANVSIEKLFIAGIIPGILVGISLILMSVLMTKKMEIVKEKKADFEELRESLIGSFFPILLVLIIFVGIMGGVFTATEASAVAVVYAGVVGFFIFKKLRIRDLPDILVSAAKTTASLSFLIACASLFAWTLAIGKVPEALTEGLLGLSDQMVNFFGSDLSPEMALQARKIVILIFLNITLLLLGMFIDAGPGLLIVVPVVLPISHAIGMDTGLEAVHFGILVVSNMIIGLVTPPVGSTLFVASAVGNTSIAKITPFILKFLVVMLVIQLIITYYPPVSTFLPSLMK